MSRSTVVIELAADARFARDLAAGGVFVPDCELRLAEECDLLVCGANHQLMLPARVVYVDPLRGAGLELVGFCPETKAQLAELEPVVRPSLGLVDEPVFDDDRFDAGAEDELAERDAERAAERDDHSQLGPGEPEPLVLEAFEDELELPMLDDAGDVMGGDRSHDSDASTGAYPHVHGGMPADIYADDIEGDARVSSPLDAEDTDAHPQPIDHTALRFRTAASPGEAGLVDHTALRFRTAASPGEAGLVDGDDDPGFDADAYTQGPEREGAAGDDEAGDPDDADPADGADELDAADEPDDAAPAQGGRARAGGRTTRPLARNVHERLRGLTLAAQLKLAVSGELHERIMLERLYGKNVWETLLRNPRLTAPEVSRIARYGSLPRILLEVIVGNNAWLQVPEVRRALLSNPRLAADQVMKVLRLTPKHELKLAAIQTAYPATVRQVAKMMLRGA